MKDISFLNCRMHTASMAETVATIKSRLCEKQFTQACGGECCQAGQHAEGSAAKNIC